MDRIQRILAQYTEAERAANAGLVLSLVALSFSLGAVLIGLYAVMAQ